MKWCVLLSLGVLALAGCVGERMTLIVNEPAEHFFVASAKSVVGETEGKPNAFACLLDFRFPPDVTCSERGAERYVDALAGGNLTHFVAGTDNGIAENGRRRLLKLDEYRQWIDLMLRNGSDGVYFFNFPLRPYRDETWRGILGADSEVFDGASSSSFR